MTDHEVPTVDVTRDAAPALAEVGRLLGIRLDDRLDLDPSPRAHGATGLVRDGRIHLDPDRWDPDSPAGRRTLAHEAVHLLQHRAAAAGTAPWLAAGRGMRAAEAEADSVAAALVGGRALPAVVVGLAGTAVPLDVGAERLGDAEVRATHASLVNLLEGAAFHGHPGSWELDVAVQRLDTEPVDVGAGAVHAQSRAVRAEFLQHLDAGDGRRRRHAVLAVLLGLDPDQLSALPADHLATLDLSGLDAAEHRAAVAILRSLDHRVLTELRTDGAPNAASVNRLVEEPPPGPAGDEADTVAGIVARVREDVADVSRAGSLRALGRLARLLTPAPETAGPPRPPTPDAGTAAAPAGVGQPADPRVRLREAVGVMARDGTLGRLLEGVGDTRNDLPDDRRRLLDAIAALAGPAVDADGADPVAREAVELLSRNVTDWAVTDADAEAALPLVLRLARHHSRLLRRLDADGHVDTLFDELPEDLLYRADVRGQTGEIMTARNGDVLFDGARRKLSRGIAGLTVNGPGTVTAREAYLASRMVQALSPGRQQEFAELAGGELVTRMNDELTASMRAAPDRHGLSPADAQAHREQLQTQLSDPGTWTDEHVGTLRTLVVLATAMGLAEWVFDRSRAYHDPTQVEVRSRVVTPHRLYDPDAGRTAWTPDTVEGSGFFSEGVFTDFGWLADAFRLMFGLEVADVDRDHAGRGFSVELQDIADLQGGDIEGAVVRTAGDDARRRAEQAAGGDTTRPDRPAGTNVLTIRHDRPGDDGHGRVSVHVPVLDLASYRSVETGSVLAFGGLRAAPLDITVAYTAGEHQRPTSILVTAGELVIDDLVAASGDSIAGAARFAMTNLDLRGGAARLPGAVAGATGTTSGLGYWLLPALAAARSLAPLLSSWPAQASALTAFEVALSTLTIDGMIVAGQQVERLTAIDVHVGQGGDRLSHLQVLKRSLERRLERTADDREAYALRRRLADVGREISVRLLDEEERQGLEDRFQREPAAMSAAERDRLRELRGSGGVVIDAASVTLQGVAGSAEFEGPLALEGISGEAAFPAGPSGLATDAARAQEFIDVGPPGLHDLDRPDVRLHVDRAAFGALTVPGDVPTPDALREQIADLDELLGAEGAEQDPGYAAVADRRAALQRALETELPRYQALQDRAAATAWRPGGDDRQSVGEPLTTGEERERAGLRAGLRLLDATTIGAGELEHLDIGADLAGTVTEVAARAAELQAIRQGGGEIEQLTGRDLSATLTSDRPGVEGRTGLPDTLAALRAGAGQLDVTGIRQDGVRVAEELHLAGIGVDVTRTGDGWDLASLQISSLSLTGLRLVGGGSVLTTYPDDPALGTAAPDAAAEPAGGGTIELLDIQAAGSLTLDEAGAPVHATVRGLVIGAVRAGDPIRYRDESRDLTLSADAISAIIATGIVIPLSDDTVPLPTAGTLTVGTIDRLAVAGRFTASLEAALAADVEPLSGTTLEVTFTPEGVEVGHLDVPEVNVGKLVFDDGTRFAEITGPAVLRGISGRASVGLPRGPDLKTGDPSFAVGAIRVAELDVAEITTPDLLYADGTRYLEAQRGADQAAVRVTGLHVRGFVMDAAGTFQGAQVATDSLSLGLVGWFAGSVVGGMEAEVEGLRLDIGPEMREVSGSVAEADIRGGGLVDGSVIGGDIAGLAVGEFAWNGQTLRLGRDDGSGGVLIDTMLLDEVTFASPQLEVEVGASGSGAVTFSGVRAAATVTFARNEAGEIDWGYFSAELGDIRADELTAQDLVLRLPEYGVELVFPPDAVTTASSVHLVPNPGEQMLIERLPTAEGAELNLQGRLEAGRAVVPRLQVAVGQRLTGETRLELDGLGVGRLGHGAVELDVQRLLAQGASLAADLRAFGVGVIPSDAPDSPGVDLQALIDAARAALSPWSGLLDHADGHLRATMAMTYWSEQLDLTITDGRVDLHRLENAFGYVVDWGFLDFEFFESRWLILSIGSEWILTWDLRTGEQDVADTLQLPLLSAFDARVPLGVAETVRSRTAGPPSTDPALQLLDVDLALDVLNPAPITVHVPPDRAGRLQGLDTVIPANALLGLQARGDIPGPAGRLRLELARLQFGRTDIRVGNVAGGTLEAGAETIDTVGAGGDVAFQGGTGGLEGSPYLPTGIEGDLEQLTATGVHVRWSPGAGP